jgi:hypothetical protein
LQISEEGGGMVAARTPNVLHAAERRSGIGSVVTRKAKSRTPNWSAKLRPELEPEVVTDKRFGDRLLLPTPLLVAEEIARVPAGATLSVSQLRSRLAGRFGAERTCPLMTGMFVKILAGVVAEDLAQRRQPRWPVWRLVNDNGTLSTTWPLDALYRATRLRQEGVKLGRRAGAWQVLPTEAG